MGDVVDLKEWRFHSVEAKGFKPWLKRFGIQVTPHMRLAELPNSVIYKLSLPKEDAVISFYEFIMDVLGLGPYLKLSYLEKSKQILLMDIHLFLTDQVRFEMMHRIDWITQIPTENYSIVEMVLDYKSIEQTIKNKRPQLSRSYPNFNDYNMCTEKDRDAFIRGLLLAALDEFKMKTNI